MDYKYICVSMAAISLLTGCKDSQLSLTGYVASMACSKAFVSGFNQDKISQEDLLLITNGSSKNANPDIDYGLKSVSSKVLTTQKTAIYRPGLGCTLVGEDVGVSDEASLRRQTMPVIPKVELNATTPWPLGTAGVSMDAIAANVFQAIDSAADKQFSENKSYQVATHSIAIAHQGRLIYERYAEDILPSTPIYGFSLGKTLATLLAGKLSTEGLLIYISPLMIRAGKIIEPI